MSSTDKGTKPTKGTMTNWYDPGQLVDTAKRTIISTTVGKYADPRSDNAVPRAGSFFDFSVHLSRSGHDFNPSKPERERDEIWIDYAADVGDGWNPTYAIAYYLAQHQLSVKGVEGPLPRGEILFFGGDGVYPTAEQQRYEDQLVTPYRMAFKAAAGGTPAAAPGLAGEPHVFALPGNHDWYDSLVSFRQLFCSHMFNERRFAADRETGDGGWRTRQKRSYFSLKLPHKWWLLGVDMQLSHNIDVNQLMYFESLIQTEMEPGDKVILCVPEPFWVRYIKYQNVTDKFEEKERSIEKLERFFQARGIELKAYIAGDLHHYRRFEDDKGLQKITAGGGGAFLHPTHDFDFRKEEKKAERAGHFKGFSLVGEYPHFDVSKGMDWKNFFFLTNNKTFGLLTAAIYFILALLIRGQIEGKFGWFEALTATVNRMINEPLAMLVILLLLLGLIFFTDSTSKKFKRRAGFLHGIAHLTAAFILGWLGYMVSQWLSVRWGVPPGTTRHNVIWFLSVLVVSGSGGYVVGSIIMGLYLFISMHFFGRHDNEAFSSMKIQDHKNFLRLHIDTAGGLTIYPLKIETVPRQWKPNKPGELDEADYFTPIDGTPPELIEEPIAIK